MRQDPPPKKRSRFADLTADLDPPPQRRTRFSSLTDDLDEDEPDKEPRRSLADKVVSGAKGAGRFLASIPEMMGRSAYDAIAPGAGTAPSAGTRAMLVNRGATPDEAAAYSGRTVTPRERLAGTAQTLANVAAGPLASRVGQAAVKRGASTAVGRILGSSASSAAGGAAYSTDEEGKFTPGGVAKGTFIGATLGALLGNVGGKAPPKGPITDPRRLLPAARTAERVPETAAPVRPAVTKPIARAVETPDVGPTLADAARTSSGKRRPVGNVSTDGLLKEWEEVAGKIESASNRSQYRVVMSEGGTHQAETPMMAATRSRGGGPSVQAKALRNLDDLNRVHSQVEEELARRGINRADIYDALDDVRAREATASAKDLPDADYGPTFDTDKIEKGVYAYDIGGVVRKGLQHPLGKGAALAAGGEALQESDDPILQGTGRGMQILAALHVGQRYGGPKVAAGASALRDKVAQSPAGRKALNLLSYDLTASPALKAAAEKAGKRTSFLTARGEQMAQKAERFDPSTQRRMSDILEKESFEPVVAPDAPETAIALNDIVDKYTTLFEQPKVRTGLITPGQEAALGGQYQKRVYAKHEAARATGATPAGGRAIRLDPMRSREDLSDAARNALGEVRELGYRLRQTTKGDAHQIATAELLNDLSTIPDLIHPDYVKATAALNAAKDAMRAASAIKGANNKAAALTQARAQYGMARAHLDVVSKPFKQHQTGLAGFLAKEEQYVRLPDSPNLGQLRGAIVKKDAADYLAQMPYLRSGDNMYGKVLKTWKRIHTVKNPGTHVGNTISNASMAHVGGLPIWEQPAALVRASKAWRKKDQDYWFLAEQGALDSGILNEFGSGQVGQARELRKLMTTTRPETKAALEAAGIKQPGKVRGALSAASKGMETAYRVEDGVFRLALFKKLTKNGMARPEAAELVRHQFVDYSTRSPLVRGLGTTIAPFIIFPVKAIPHITQQAIAHPERWLTLAATWGAVDQYSRRKYGAINEQDLRPDQRRPKYGSYLIPGTVQVGPKSVVDVARWTPYSAALNASPPGATPFGADRAPSILGVGGPIADVYDRLRGRDPFTGDEMKGKSVGRQIFEGVRSLTTPSAVSFQAPRVIKDIQNRDWTATKTDALGFLGLRPTAVEPGRQKRSADYRLQSDRSELSGRMRREIDKAKNNPARQASLRAEWKQLDKQLIEQFKRDYPHAP